MLVRRLAVKEDLEDETGESEEEGWQDEDEEEEADLVENENEAAEGEEVMWQVGPTRMAYRVNAH